MKPSRSFCKPLCAVVLVAKFGRFWTVFGTVDHKVVLFSRCAVLYYHCLSALGAM